MLGVERLKWSHRFDGHKFPYIGHIWRIEGKQSKLAQNDWRVRKSCVWMGWFCRSSSFNTHSTSRENTKHFHIWPFPPLNTVGPGRLLGRTWR